MSEEKNTENDNVAEVETVFDEVVEPSLEDEEKKYDVVGSLDMTEDTVKRIILTAISEEDTNKDFFIGETMCTFQWHMSKWDTSDSLCTIVFSKPTDGAVEEDPAGDEEIVDAELVE
jgi:hypothetical protein